MVNCKTYLRNVSFYDFRAWSNFIVEIYFEYHHALFGILYVVLFYIIA